MLELLLRVQTEPGAVADLAVELAERHRVADLALALAHHLGVPLPRGHTPNLACDRLGQVLEPQLRVLDSGLLSGDLLRIGLTSLDPGLGAGSLDGGRFCDVISGPSSGTSIPLASGRYAVGRDPSCDLVLTDPTVSKRHATLLVDPAGPLEIAPVPGSTNPVLIDGVAIDGPTPLPHGSVVQLGACALTVREYSPTASAARDQLGQIPFNRTPYRHPDLRPVEIRGPGDPPTPYEPRPLMLAMIVMPLVAGVAFALLLQRWYFLLFAVLSPVSMLGSWWSERRRGGTTHRQQVEVFERRFAEWIERYDDALQLERRRRYDAAPDVADLARRAELRTADLWPRTRWSPGFLELRLGLGSAPAFTTTNRPSGVDDDPDARIGDAIDERVELPSVPITVDLIQHGVLAVHGPPLEVETTVGAVLTQAAALHSPDDLVLCGYLHPRRTLGGWVRWIPHTRTVTSPLEGEHLVVGRESADDLLRRLLETIAERDLDQPWPHLLVVLDELVEADQLLVAAVLESGPAAGVHALWVGNDHARVPRQARAILACPPIASGERARLWFTDPAQPTHHLDPDRIGLDAAPRVAHALAPVRDASSASAAASIPRTAPLLETMGTPSLDASAVAARWQRPGSGYGLAAPIGIGPSGPLIVDLVEHGPHALIAGTSGAGKSELLRSYIAGLVATYPPTRLNLLFIDYKGGASSDAFQRVPHTVGYVTNLGADLARRALVSLRAELDRRMRLLEGRAKDLAEMLERYPDEAPASLVIVVDEFATLVKEIPDFVAGMVDIAQRGRSLGIHLILATQRPAGAVSEDILANTNLRIALRMLDAGDSTSILGSNEAASIPAPLRGRAFARLGGGGTTEFQAGYAGASFLGASGVTPVVVAPFPSDGRTTRYPAPVQDDEERTHLDVVLDAVCEAATSLGHVPGRRPWLEELPRLLDLDTVVAGRFGEVPPQRPGRDVLLGVVDEPEQQRQRPFVVDLEAHGGLLAFGTGGSGRTTLLRTVAASLVSGASAAQVQLHVLDFAGRGLDALRDLPHVAAVAPSDDLERATRIIEYLQGEVARRQRRIAEEAADGFEALNRTLGVEDRFPRIVLLLDGFEGFLRAFDRMDLYPWTERLVALLLAGRSVGIHLVATADRRVSVPASLASVIGGRVILRAVDADALTDLGVPPAAARGARLGDGRAVLPDGSLVQIAAAGGEVGAAAQARSIAARSRATGASPRAWLPELPDDVRLEQLPRPPSGDRLPFGVADLTLEPVMCDLRLQHLAVLGPSESGRSTALRTLARALRAAGRHVWIVAEGPESPLAISDWPNLAVRATDHGPLFEKLAASVQEGADRPALVIDRAERVDDLASTALEPLLDDDLVRLVAGVDLSTMTSYASGWRGELKRTRRMLVLQPDDVGDLSMLTATRLAWRPGQPFPVGRGLYLAGREVTLVQVAR